MPDNRSVPLRFEPLEVRQLLTGAPELLHDLPGVDTALAENSVVVGNTFYFVANGPVGEELWKSDGTAEGTLLVKDIRPGIAGSGPRWLTNLNGTLVFTANDGTSGAELWMSDGTAEGTVLLKDIRPGTEGASPSSLKNLNGTLLFSANDGSQGYELWRSNGTAVGTTLVKDLVNGPSGAFPWGFTQVGTNAYFSARNASLGRELWKTDGTAAGTSKMASFGGNYNDASRFTNVNGTLYFAVSDFSSGTELWKSNGTAAGTVMITDIPPFYFGSYPADLVNFAGTLFFSARPNSNSGRELFKSNGTAAGTVMVKDIIPGFYGANPAGLTVVGSTLFFTANDGISGTELWKSDGSEAGTVPVKDILPGATGAFPSRLTNLGGTLLFLANDGAHGLELWKSDGSAEGTVLVKDIVAGDGSIQPTDLAVLGGDLFFIERGGASGAELWKSDGSEPGTQFIEVVVPKLGLDADPREFVEVNGATYIATATGLWMSPGGGAEAAFLNSIDASNLIRVGGRLFFTGQAGYDVQLWTSDGTVAGTIPLQTFAHNTPQPFFLTEMSGILYFAAGELWTSDGSVEGTVKLKDIRPGSDWADVSHLANVNGTLFFAANDGITGSELWKSDGSEGGTQLVRDFDYQVAPRYLVNVGGTLFFSGYDADHGRELWTSDGSDTGTHLVKELQDGESSYPKLLTNVAGRLYFVASDGINGRELWTSDGTEEGTKLVKDIYVSEYANPENLVAVGSRLYFVADDGVHGRELWVSDGSEDGTELVQDIRPDAASSAPAFLTNVDGHLYFTADDGIAGSQLWHSDGTAEGTAAVVGWPGEVNSAPKYLANVGGALVFSANDGVSGRDPWIVPAAFSSSITGRHLFYNRSKFDGGSGAINAADDGAIASDKAAYLPGSGLASSANVSSYSRGINGLMIDLAGTHGVLSADDFVFRVGDSNTPENWALAPPPSAMSVRTGAGSGGADRVTIVWPDGAIKNTWLQVLVEGNDALGGLNTNTGLTASDVFFFGNRIGDTFENSPPGVLITNVNDEIKVRSSIAFGQTATSLYDFDRNGLVNVMDQIIARGNFGFLTLLDIEFEPPVVAAVPTAQPVVAIPVVASVAPNSFAAESRSAIASALAIVELTASEHHPIDLTSILQFGLRLRKRD